MKKWAAILVGACLALVCRADDRINVGVYTRDLQGVGQRNINVSLVPTTDTNLTLPRTYNSNVVLETPKTKPTDTNGDVTFTNVLWGNYYLQIQGNPPTVYKLAIGTNLSGTVSAAAMAVASAAFPPDPATNYYTQAQVDALLAAIKAGLGSSFTNLNLAGVTTNSVWRTMSNFYTIVASNGALLEQYRGIGSGSLGGEDFTMRDSTSKIRGMGWSLFGSQIYDETGTGTATFSSTTTSLLAPSVIAANQTLVDSTSVLTEGLGDARYASIVNGTPGQLLIANTLSNLVPKTMSGDSTINTNGVLALKSTGTAGTYYKTTFDAQGRETSGVASLGTNDLPSIGSGNLSDGAALTRTNESRPVNLSNAQNTFTGIGSGLTGVPVPTTNGYVRGLNGLATNLTGVGVTIISNVDASVGYSLLVMSSNLTQGMVVGGFSPLTGIGILSPGLPSAPIGEAVMNMNWAGSTLTPAFSQINGAFSGPNNSAPISFFFAASGGTNIAGAVTNNVVFPWAWYDQGTNLPGGGTHYGNAGNLWHDPTNGIALSIWSPTWGGDGSVHWLSNIVTFSNGGFTYFGAAAVISGVNFIDNIGFGFANPGPSMSHDTGGAKFQFNGDTLGYVWNDKINSINEMFLDNSGNLTLPLETLKSLSSALTLTNGKSGTGTTYSMSGGQFTFGTNGQYAAADMTGTLADARLSSDVALTNVTPQIIYQASLVATNVSSSASNNLVQFSIPGGTLGTNKSVSIEIQAEVFNNSGSASVMTNSFLYGTTLAWSSTFSWTSTANTNEVIINLRLSGQNSASSQWLSGNYNSFTRGAATGTGTGNLAAASGLLPQSTLAGLAAENSANALNFTYASGWVVSNANTSMIIKHVIAKAE